MTSLCYDVIFFFFFFFFNIVREIVESGGREEHLKPTGGENL